MKRAGGVIGLGPLLAQPVTKCLALAAQKARRHATFKLHLVNGIPRSLGELGHRVKAVKLLQCCTALHDALSREPRQREQG